MIHIGNVNDVVTEDLINICTERANKFKTRNRNINTIIKHTIIGEAVELLVCSSCNLIQTPFDIMEYDATNNIGLKYEIKHTSENDKWWNYSADNYSFFLRNALDLDYIILCYHDNKTGNVYLKFKADASTFASYSAQSKYNTKHYYNVDIASRHDACIIY